MSDNSDFGNSEILDVLLESQRLGFIGPGDVMFHVKHAERFLEAFGGPVDSANCLDLGSGGGLPGLVLAVQLPTLHWTLLDAGKRRCDFLRYAVDQLGLSNCEVVGGRAEELAHLPNFRHTFDVVTARSFAPPGTTAECATGFIRSGGRLVVSEPPRPPVDPQSTSVDEFRWDDEALAQLNMRVESVSSIAVIEQAAPCGDKWPRRNGIPSKRPLF
jgi:16S rRNA (guanine527-N7)-methyltransferase